MFFQRNVVIIRYVTFDYEIVIRIVVVITFQTANPNWESETPRTNPVRKEKTLERKGNKGKTKQQLQKDRQN